MVENLTKLYNTLLLIETKGESTKAMAKCLEYIESLVNDLKKPVNSKQVSDKSAE